MPKCTPEQLHQLADYLLSKNVGEVNIRLETAKIPTASDSPVETEIRRKLGYAPFIRTMRGAFGPEFTARVLDRLHIIVNKYETFRSTAFKSFMTALEPAGVKGFWKKLAGASGQLDEDLFKVITNMDETGRYIGPVQAFPDGVVESGKQIRAVMEDIGRKNDIRASKYIAYRRALHDSGGKGPILHEETRFTADFNADMTPEEARFFGELERLRIPRNWDSKSSAVFQDFVNAVGSKRILTPQINALETAEVRPFFNAKYARKSDGTMGYMADDSTGLRMWDDLRAHVYGTPTDLDKKLVYVFQQLGDMFGLKTALATRDVYGIMQSISHLFYAGVLSTPGSAIRQFFQLVPSYADLGARPVAAGMQMLFNRDYIRSLVDRGILVPSLEAVHEQVGLARGAGRVIHRGTEAALKVFDLTDRAVRVITAGGAEFKFNEAMRRGIETLKADHEIKEQVLKLVSLGRDQEAKDIYMMHVVAQTQGVFNRTNRPELLRGSVGQAIGMLQSYPMNLMEMYVHMGRRAGRAIKGEDPFSEVMPMFRMVGAVGGLMLGGKEAFGLDLSSNFLSFPGRAPIPQMAGTAMQFGRSNAEWMWGQAFMTGETDYHKRLRLDADKEFARQSINFIPFGLLGKQTWNVIDTPTFSNTMKQMGFPPLAEEINLEVRAKAAESRKAKRLAEKYATD